MQFETNSMFSCRFSGPLSASSELHLLLLSEHSHSMLRLNQGPCLYSAYSKREVRRLATHGSHQVLMPSSRGGHRIRP
jgi:hypothetical protein